jgi:hypothetical protein
VDPGSQAANLTDVYRRGHGSDLAFAADDNSWLEPYVVGVADGGAPLLPARINAVVRR